MTRQRNDNHGTEFESWRREHPDLRSDKGYLATDIDFVWRNYKTGEFMLVEEKRYRSAMTYSQCKTFSVLDEHFMTHPLYKGFHLLQFENTSPDDGKIYWDRKEITVDKLIELLQFKNINKRGMFYSLLDNIK